jgi:hypothetical protein
MKKNSIAALTFTGNSVYGIIDGAAISASQGHPNWSKIVGAIKSKDYHLLPKLVNIGSCIVRWANNKAYVKDRQIYFNGEVVHNTLSMRILNLMSDGFDANPMLRFLENLMLNPSVRSRNELYGFLDYGKLPITEDGCFLAYKVVDNSYYAKRSNPDGSRNRHYVGDVVRMNREEVDPHSERTCSTGLHFCSLDYVPCYGCSGSDKVMIIKLNPRDVVSIPFDYKNTKGRCCEYQVVSEYKGAWNISAFDEQVYSSDGGEYEPEEEDDWEDDFDDDEDYVAYPLYADNYGEKPTGQKFWNVRDDSGKFTKKH